MTNKKIIIIIAAVFISAAAAAAALIIIDASRLPSTKGLNSRQTVELFYTGINHLDLQLMDISSAGKAAEAVRKKTEQTAVTAQIARTVKNIQTVTPAQWFYLKNTVPAQTAGISCLKIDNIDADSSKPFIREKRKTAPLTEEYGQKIGKNQKRVMYAEYFYIRGDENSAPSVTKHFDTLTVTYVKNRWLITDITQTMRPYRSDTSSFTADYGAALADPLVRGSILLAASDMRGSYRWIPSPHELVAAAYQMLK